MALRRCCWKLVGPGSRLLWSGSVQPGTYSPVGRVFVNTRQGYKSSELQLRRFTSRQPPSPDVSYEELKRLLSEQKAVLVDVREPWELREYGFIPGSVNVPLGQMDTALQLGPEEFRERYGGEMPLQTDHIVFVCLAGIRSKTALSTAASLGYKDIQHYPGGWHEWAEREQIK
ncbi:thiosulfate sulfurtransferase/rhodanese-like domain-containing protein 3 [Nematolebias whitei]|uniref:thiosulfate sulfurtransferase/rhodanese-like domain-containing protein 3 n=1 Tax=Nematolebias whitei TaxID=451745 RepID=UPI00189BB8C2|nr:thiosulfate sulfurtransferase/rhodanese-like domain-containing protein 3 [Nematolebias whitei]